MQWPAGPSFSIGAGSSSTTEDFQLTTVGSVIVGAGNRAHDAALARQMPSALVNRLVHVHLKPSHREWLEWAEANGVHPWVLDYVRARPTQLATEVPPAKEEPFSTPRAWHTVRDALDELLRRNPGVRPEKLVSAHIERVPGDRGDNGEGVKGVADFLALARDPEIVELVSGVIGENVIRWGCHVFCKPAAEGYETPWHQDGHYWPIRPLATCTVWVALEPSTRANGCLRVIPGSHRDRHLHPHPIHKTCRHRYIF